MLFRSKEENIKTTDLVVADSRMYRGRINWAFQGRPYIEGTDFLNILSDQEQLQKNAVPITIYFFECVSDDCGWGTVKDQPEFNASMESLVSFFSQNGEKIETFDEPDRSKSYYPLFIGEKKEEAAVYKATMALNPAIIQFASQPKSWWIYTIGFEPKEQQFDYYEIHSTPDQILNNLAHMIVTLALLLAFISPLYVIYLVRKSGNQ